MNRKAFERISHGTNDVLSLHFSGVIEKSEENSGQDSRCPYTDSNRRSIDVIVELNQYAEFFDIKI
jgi:hypothetical protein